MRDESPAEATVNVARIGDTVIRTNPAELFVELGLQVREASEVRVTIISELTDGDVGYVPTEYALTRGGYEAYPARSSMLTKGAGDRIVEWTRDLPKSVFAHPAHQRGNRARAV